MSTGDVSYSDHESALSFARRYLPMPVRRLLKPAAFFFYRKDLNQLAQLCGTDKWGSHWYTQHYQRYFEHLRKAHLNLLEIGVGGYASEYGGESLRMWKAYFPNAKVVGIDIEDKTRFSAPRIDIRVCDQTDADGLVKLSNQYGGFDIIVDDGSHISDHVIKTFHILFPLLSSNGIYAIEDTQTSYWPDWGGGMNNPRSLTAFFKGLTDGLNHVEFPVENYQPTYFDLNIVELAFFHNLIIIRKGSNTEKTNMPKLVKQAIAAGA